ncbi:MAG TPA: TipAS antibiotic-recognition domain-containing protein [Candidatus Angelobacter sp.]|nr:TipAS antibiotic-recognition domain-containing protein [Candidatus Angelobacter sp.]
MKNNNFKKKYFTDEAWARWQELRNRESQPEMARKWEELYQEAGRLVAEDPAGEIAQEFAERWHQHWEHSTAGDAEIQDGLRKAWADRKNWPPDARERLAQRCHEEVALFISRIFAARAFDLRLKKHYGEHLWSRIQRFRKAASKMPKPKFRDPRERPTAESREQIFRSFIELLHLVQAALGQDPAGPEAEALAVQWTNLWGSSTTGKPAIKAELQQAIDGPQHWPPEFQANIADLDFESISQFIKKAIACCLKRRYRESQEMARHIGTAQAANSSPSDLWLNLLQHLWRRAGLAH